jgi:hypothetical protein
MPSKTKKGKAKNEASDEEIVYSGQALEIVRALINSINKPGGNWHTAFTQTTFLSLFIPGSRMARYQRRRGGAKT